MGPQKKQDPHPFNNKSNISEEIHPQLDNLPKITSKLQENYEILSKSLKQINKTLNNLTITVQNNKETINSFSLELKPKNTFKTIQETTENHGERIKIERERFLSALTRILFDLKKNDQKNYFDIKSVKIAFLKRYYLEDETKFDHWLLELYWSNEIELISDIEDYSVRDLYDNVYHHIRY